MVAKDLGESKPYYGEVESAKAIWDCPLNTEEIIGLAASEFTRKAEFAKLAFWLRAYGNDEDMAQFIEAIAMKKKFARDYRVQTHLLKMMIKLFKSAEGFLKPYNPEEGPATYVNRFKAINK